MIYQDTHHFSREELERLFLSVCWSSGHYPEKLKTAMEHFDTVYSAWDGDRLVGLVSVMDDGIMNAYVHYLLVDPDYQGHGIGRTLVEMVKEKYRDYLRLIVIAYDEEAAFYEQFGFVKSENSSPLFLTSLWT
ncbi:MAG: GNAT family N-acetyltransferase [Solobacterium sp.]|nr:GNAT family N-acetyltransferase [Solobacterium sp.]